MGVIKQHSRLLLQLLVLVFGMNASLGYGACCAEMNAMSGEAEQVMQMAEDVPPCHKQPSDDANQPQDLNSCCATCVMGMPSLELDYVAAAFLAPDYVAPFSYYVSSNIDPLFRPPIFHLS